MLMAASSDPSETSNLEKAVTAVKRGDISIQKASIGICTSALQEESWSNEARELCLKLAVALAENPLLWLCSR